MLPSAIYKKLTHKKYLQKFLKIKISENPDQINETFLAIPPKLKKIQKSHIFKSSTPQHTGCIKNWTDINLLSISQLKIWFKLTRYVEYRGSFCRNCRLKNGIHCSHLKNSNSLELGQKNVFHVKPWLVCIYFLIKIKGCINCCFLYPLPIFNDNVNIFWTANVWRKRGNDIQLILIWHTFNLYQQS